MAAISAMSVPVGPHGSLLVAVELCQRRCDLIASTSMMPTIPNFYLHRRVTFGDIFDCPHDLRHAPWSGRRTPD